MKDNKFVNYKEAIQLIHNEAQYAASILSQCICYVSAQEISKNSILVTVKFERMGFDVWFQIEVSYDASYLYGEVKSKLEYNCEISIVNLISKLYGNEEILERSEENGQGQYSEGN